MSLSYNYPPQMAYPSAPPVYRAFPAPPRLHWAWVLVLCVVTLGMFIPVWLFVQARWVKKATGNPRPIAWAMAYLLLIPVIFVLDVVARVVFLMTNHGNFGADFAMQIEDFSRVAGFLLYIASVYLLKSALESAPVRIPLHGLATFFFGPVYFQYFLRDYSVEGKLGEQLSGFGETLMAEVPEVPPQT